MFRSYIEYTNPKHKYSNFIRVSRCLWSLFYPYKATSIPFTLIKIGNTDETCMLFYLHPFKVLSHFIFIKPGVGKLLLPVQYLDRKYLCMPLSF